MPVFDNLANLPATFPEQYIEPLEGTFLFERDVLGKLVAAARGAMWSRELVDTMAGAQQFGGPTGYPDSWLIQAGGVTAFVVGVDPSSGAGQADECGIVTVAICRDGRAYVIADRSGPMSPDEWGMAVAMEHQRLVDVYRYEHPGAGVTVAAEANQGGEMVRSVISQFNRDVIIELVHAKIGKQARAEPVLALSQRDKVRLGCEVTHGPLTAQLTTWEPATGNASPDRLDAFVHAVRYGLADELTPYEHLGEIDAPRSATRRG